MAPVSTTSPELPRAIRSLPLGDKLLRGGNRALERGNGSGSARGGTTGSTDTISHTLILIPSGVYMCSFDVVFLDHIITMMLYILVYNKYHHNKTGSGCADVVG